MASEYFRIASSLDIYCDFLTFCIYRVKFLNISLHAMMKIPFVLTYQIKSPIFKINVDHVTETWQHRSLSALQPLLRVLSMCHSSSLLYLVRNLYLLVLLRRWPISKLPLGKNNYSVYYRRILFKTNR